METAIRHSFITIRPAGNLWEISFTYDQILVEAMREIGADWDTARKVWVVAEVAKADALAYANATAGDKQSFLDRVRAEKIKNLGVPKMDLTLPLSPPGMTLMPHQIEGVKWVSERTGSLLAFDMGTGKTPTSVACLNATPGFGRALIICPATLKNNWFNELKGNQSLDKRGWLVDQSRTVGIVQGSYFPPTDIVIINPEVIDRHKPLLDSIDWDFIFVDELHVFRNPKAKRTKALIGGTRGRGATPWRPLRGRRCVGLTGTPMVNSPVDLWSQCNWLDPKRWPSLYWFENRYCVKEKQFVRGGRSVLMYKGAKNLDELNQRLKGTVMLRKKKAEVLPDLPPKFRQVIELDIPEAASFVREEGEALAKMSRRISELRAQILLASVSGSDEEHKRAIAALSDYYASGDGEHIAMIRQRIARTKIPYVVDDVRNTLLDPDKKVIIGAHHVAIIEEISKAFTDAGVKHVLYYGGTSKDDRPEVERSFQMDKDCRVFIGGLTAAGLGLNLTAADQVCFVEMDYVPSVMTQFEDRSHRKGQRNSVLIKYFAARASLDARISKIAIAKLEMADKGIDGGLAAQEPVDWLGDHRSAPTEDQLSAPVPPTAIAASTYGMRRLVENPKAYGVSDTDLIIAERLCDRELVGKPAALAKWLMDKYLEPKSPAPSET